MKGWYRASLFVLLLLAGCTSTYEQRPVTSSQAPLAAGKAVVIATPENFTYGSEAYPNSGAATASAIRAAFARHTGSLVVVPDCRDVACLRSRHSDGTYFVVPMILHWEDRATEWSGKKDKIEIRIAVYDASAAAEIAGTVISGKSKFMTMGGDHPQDLLAEPVQAWVDSIH